MIFTGINSINIPSGKSYTLDFQSISITFSGDKYNQSLPSGFHFGISGSSDSISYSGISGKIYDPQNRLIFGYRENIPFSLKTSFDSGNYDCYINDEIYVSNGTKNNFSGQQFFFNSNGLTIDATVNIYSKEIDYSLYFPSTFSGEYVTGYLTNNSDYGIRIFSGTITEGNINYFSATGINNIDIAPNESGALVLHDLLMYTGVTPYINLSLFTSFGNINSYFSIYKS